MNTKLFFAELRDEVSMLLDGGNSHLPHDWEETTEDLIKALNIAKKLGTNPIVVTVASVFPNSIGRTMLTILEDTISKVLPTLEIAQGAEQAAAGLPSGTAKANAVIGYIVTNINKLPEQWQGKHWLNVAETILVDVLGMTSTEANAIVNVKLGQLKTW